LELLTRFQGDESLTKDDDTMVIQPDPIALPIEDRGILPSEAEDLKPPKSPARSAKSMRREVSVASPEEPEAPEAETQLEKEPSPDDAAEGGPSVAPEDGDDEAKARAAAAEAEAEAAAAAAATAALEAETKEKKVS
jgi:hypothetical protein